MDFKIRVFCILDQQVAIMIDNNAHPSPIKHLKRAANLIKPLKTLHELVIDVIVDHGLCLFQCDFYNLRVH
jgi:hypothetical protein